MVKHSFEKIRIVTIGTLLFLGILIPGGITFATAPSWENVGAAGFSGESVQNTSLALDSNDIPYVAYGDSSGSVTVMKFNGSTWDVVGTPSFSGGGAQYISLAIDSNNIPYVAYGDATNSYKATVMKFNGTAWEVVGTVGFSAGNAYYLSLAFDSSNIPYLAYQDVNSGNKATVMKFNGTAWEVVGTVGFSAGEANYVSLALNSSNVPYVAYEDNATSGKATVMKFNGSTWENVGTPEFSGGVVQYVSLAFDSNNIPYVAYSDSANSYKATVLKFNGSAWENIGDVGGFSADEVTDLSIKLDSNNVPYVAYEDVANGYKVTAMKFNGSAWEYVGMAGFSSGYATYASLAINSGNIPFVAFSDFPTGSYATVMKYTTFAPILAESSPVSTPTTDATPSYSFTSDQAGTITYGGSCSSNTTAAVAGTNTIDFATLTNGTYADCSITVTNAYGQASSALTVTSFTVTVNAPVASTGHRSGSTSIPAQVANLLAIGNTEAAHELMAQWPNLFPGVSTSSVATSTTKFLSFFTRDLSLYSVGEDVRALQQFLNVNGFILASSGPGSLGNETTFFGQLTRAAVVAYQKTNHILPAVGYVGPLTRASISGTGS